MIIHSKKRTFSNSEAGVGDDIPDDDGSDGGKPPLEQLRNDGGQGLAALVVLAEAQRGGDVGKEGRGEGWDGLGAVLLLVEQGTCEEMVQPII